MPRKVGVLYGMERSFPPALVEEIRRIGGADITAEPVQIGSVRQDVSPGYDVILDRISQDVPFYRTFLKGAAARGAQVLPNPFWWCADDKFTCNLVAEQVGVAVPKTVLLPHKDHPPGTRPDSFTNLAYPLDWDGVFAYLGFPIFLKPAYGGGWKDVYKVDDPAAFFRAYDQTHTLTMIAQEAIDFTEYYRCYGLGRERVRIMRYDPKAPFERRYVRDAPPTEPKLLARMERDVLALCRALGYDVNTVELAVRNGVPIAIDFMNPAPDADLFSVGPDNFQWMVKNMAEVLVERARNPKPLEMTGTWPAGVKAR